MKKIILLFGLASVLLLTLASFGSATTSADRLVIVEDTATEKLITTEREGDCAVHTITIDDDRKHYILFSTLINIGESHLMQAKIESLSGSNVVSHCTSAEWENANATMIYEVE